MYDFTKVKQNLEERGFDVTCFATAEEAARALSPRALMRAVGVLERLRDAAGYNVGTGHLAGWLCAALCT